MVALAPRLSAYDPLAKGEGSLDPLGLEAIAERLAERLLPGMTARMWRPRALTFMAVSAHVIEPFVDDYTADLTTPAFLVFEWMYAEAMAREQLTQTLLPGIQRAHKIRTAGGRLAGRTYLKSPAALGIHGFYRRLARTSRVIEDSETLGENGESLIRAWERERGLAGFLDGEGAGGKALKSLRHQLESGLAKSHSSLAEGSAGGKTLRWELKPEFPDRSSRERRELRRILDEDESRRESLQLIRDGLADGALGGADEHRMAEWIRRRGSRERAAAARTLLAYERVATLISEAFDLLLWASSQSGFRPRHPGQLARSRHRDIAALLPEAVSKLSAASDHLDTDQPRADLIAELEDTRSAPALLAKLLDRHYAVQEGKGAQGKLPWVERTERGVVVRSDYVRDSVPVPNEGFMHPARLANARYFVEELG